MKKYNSKVLGLLSLLMLFSFSGCRDVYTSTIPLGSNGAPSSGGPGGVDSDGNPCTTSLLTTTLNLKIMFMIDNSSSTLNTDPNKMYRVQTIQNFINAYGSHTNLKFGLGYFSTYAYVYDMSTSSFTNGPVTSPFGNAAQFTQTLNTYNTGVAPSGNTSYVSAFNMIQGSMVSDATAAGTAQAYVAIFMSDGQPTDIPSNTISVLNGIVDNLFTAVTAQHSSTLTVSGVYFGPDGGTEAKANIQAIATRGHGQYLDTNVSTAFNIEDLITIPGCQ